MSTDLYDRVKACSCNECRSLINLIEIAGAQLRLNEKAAVRACELAVVAASGKLGLTEEEVVSRRRAYARHLDVRTDGATQDPNDCRRIRHAIKNSNHNPDAKNRVHIGSARAFEHDGRYFLLW